MKEGNFFLEKQMKKYTIEFCMLILLTTYPFLLAKEERSRMREPRIYSVINIRHSVALSDKHPPMRQIILNFGSKHGAQVNQEWVVNRKDPIIDSLTQDYYRDAVIPIGRVRLIHVQEELSIAVPLEHPPVEVVASKENTPSPATSVTSATKEEPPSAPETLNPTSRILLGDFIQVPNAGPQSL
jgi:hypothetical protein